MLVDPSSPVAEAASEPIGMGLAEAYIGGADQAPEPEVPANPHPAPIDPAPLAPPTPLPRSLGAARDIDEMPSGVFSGSARFHDYHVPGVEDYEVPDQSAVSPLDVLGKLERTDEYQQAELLRSLPPGSLAGPEPDPELPRVPGALTGRSAVVTATIPKTHQANAVQAPPPPAPQRAPAPTQQPSDGPGLLAAILVSVLGVLTAVGIAYAVLSSSGFRPQEPSAEGLTARPAAGVAAGPATPPSADAVAASERGLLRVRSNLKVLVYVDGVQVGMTPQDQTVVAGSHEVSAVIPGQPATRQVRNVEVGTDGGTVEVLFEY